MKKTMNHLVIKCGSQKVATLLLLFCFVVSVNLKAQDSLVVFDLAATLKPKVDTPATRGAAPHLSSQLKLTAFFKVNQPQNISKIYIRIGQSPNGTEFKNDSLTTTNVNDVLNTYLGSQQVGRFWTKSTSYEIDLPINNMQNINWLTIYVKDNATNYSAKKYFKIQ